MNPAATVSIHRILQLIPFFVVGYSNPHESSNKACQFGSFLLNRTKSEFNVSCNIISTVVVVYKLRSVCPFLS